MRARARVEWKVLMAQWKFVKAEDLVTRTKTEVQRGERILILFLCLFCTSFALIIPESAYSETAASKFLWEDKSNKIFF